MSARRPPPRVARALVRLLLPAGPYRNTVVGDLEEEFCLRSARRPRAWAVLRYLLDAAGIGARLRISTRRTAPTLPSGDSTLSTFAHDVRLALRIFRAHPGFATLTVATLAIGIGANSAMFSIVNVAMLRPLPYADPDRIVQVWGSNVERDVERWGVSLHDYEDWRASSESLSEIGVYNTRSANLSHGNTPERVRYALVSPSIFGVLGIDAAQGRTFAEDENLPGLDGVVVLSHGFWRSALDGDPTAVGKTLVLDGAVLTVVGVMPEGFYFPGRTTQLWKPFGMRPDDSGDRGGRWVRAVGRLQPGVDLEAATAEMEAIAAGLEEAYPETNDGFSVFLEPRRALTVAGSRGMLLVGWGMVAVVLLIVCVNVANLVMVRTTTRQREIAVRAALGAGRGRIVRGLLAESLTLSMAGGAVGAALAVWATSGLRGLQSTGIPGLDTVTVDAPVLAYTLVISLTTAVAFGLWPALAASRLDLVGVLKGARGGGGRDRRLREALVAAQVALCVVVLIGAALLIRTVWRLQSVHLGFEIDSRVEAVLSPSWEELPERESMLTLYNTILERIAAFPATRAAGAINTAPLAGANAWSTQIFTDDRQDAAAGDRLLIRYRVVAGDYFGALGIPILAGRAVRSADTAATPHVIVLSNSAAARIAPGENAIGKEVWFVPPEHPAHQRFTVVGVAADVQDNSLQLDPSPLVYVSLPQAQWGHFQSWTMSLIVHAAGDPGAAVSMLREAVRAVDPTLPLYAVQTLERRLGDALAPSRFNMGVLASFGLIALTLAALGVYGVMSFMVGERRREIAMRVALGADGSRVIRLVVGRGLAVASVGVLAGAGIARLLHGALEGLLFGVDATDPIAHAVVVGLLLTIALIASLVPARRAASLHPADCLHDR